MCGPRKTIDDSLAGLLDALRDLLDDRRLVVVSPDKDASFLPPRRGGERLAVLHRRLEPGGLLRGRDFLPGGHLHAPPLRAGAPRLPGRARAQIGRMTDDASVPCGPGLR